MLTYIAVPYSNNKAYAFEQVNKLAAEYIRQGHFVFSPISHCHPIALAHDLPTDFE